MKKSICMLMTAAMLLSLCACGAAAPAAQESGAWSREGYFSDGNGNIIYILKSEDAELPGWTVGVMFDDLMTGSVIQQEGDTLHGDLNAWDESAEPYVVTVSAEGQDGVQLQVEGGETYHFTPMEVQKASILVSVDTEGLGNIAYAEGETAPEIDPERPYTSAQVNLAEPAVYSFTAAPMAGNLFVEWTKNGEFFSKEPQITVTLDESMALTAVFAEDPDWQNPVMNVVGEYQSGRAHAQIECFGADEALITIEWGSSASELSRWFMFGRLDGENRTIAYYGCSKSNLVYDEKGEVKSEEVEYEDGTGSLTFTEDGGFVWHEDQAADREDLVFAFLPVREEAVSEADAS